MAVEPCLVDAARMENHSDSTLVDPMDFWRNKLNGSKYVMAPMVDMSELSFRMLGREYGVELCYTPMLHAQRYINEDHYRKHFFTTCPQDRPLIVQFCANDAETFVAAAKMVEDCCDAVDLNLGCPQIIARKGHYGAFLQDEWDLIQDIVSKACKEIRVPVTCKIRIHPEQERTLEYAKMLEKAGCKLLTVHGRTREQKGHSTGLADWDIIREIRSVINIPMFANGNILSREDADECIRYTGVQGVMAAEGLLHNPAIFADKQIPVWEMARKYLEYAGRYITDTGHMRTHLFRILAYSVELYPDLRTKLAESSQVEMYHEIIDELEKKIKNDMQEEIRTFEHENSLKSDDSIHINDVIHEDDVTDKDVDDRSEIDVVNDVGIGSKRGLVTDNDGDICKKKIRLNFNEVLERSARKWKEFPVWLTHARARVSKSLQNSSEGRKQIFGLHLDRADGNPELEVASEAKAGAKQSKTERKLRQFERRVAGMKIKRQKKRDDRKERRAELIAQGVSLKKHPDEDHVTKRERVARMKEKVEEAMITGQRVCIDMGLGHLMSQKESAKLAQQIRRLYGSNRKSDQPFHLFMTSLDKNGVLYQECARKNMGFDNYAIDKHEASHLDVFDQTEIVYLSPDADEELESLDGSKVYIIGGLVDETVNKGRTTEAAEKAQIRHVRLPIDKYMTKGPKGNYSKILTVNQVFDILLTYHNTGSWSRALREHVPPRTGYVLKNDVDVS